MLAPAVWPQSVPVPQRGNIEASVLGGFNIGGRLSSVSAIAENAGADPVVVVPPSSDGSVGLQVGIAVSRRIVGTLEWAYVSGGRIQFVQDYYRALPPYSTLRTDVEARTSAMDLNAGLHYLFPLARAPRVVLYTAAGAGVIRPAGDIRAAEIGREPGRSFSGRTRTYNPAGYLGGGVRYHVTERAGLRFEARLYVASQSANGDPDAGLGASGRLVFGFFYRIR